MTSDSILIQGIAGLTATHITATCISTGLGAAGSRHVTLINIYNNWERFQHLMRICEFPPLLTAKGNDLTSAIIHTANSTIVPSKIIPLYIDMYHLLVSQQTKTTSIPTSCGNGHYGSHSTVSIEISIGHLINRKCVCD